jgi:2-amino-4-hydroxy-6-hydroxymethyldihydropteridine diphosphokinase
MIILQWKLRGRGMARSYLSIGSNMGDKKAFLEESVELLKAYSEIKVTGQSSFYETDPVGYLDQDLFINIALEIETIFSPHDLLKACQSVENKLHRKRIIRWGPRTVDIDIILYDDLSLNHEDLIIPHPRAFERAFVMVPIYELNEILIIEKVPIKQLINKISTEGVRKI